MVVPKLRAHSLRAVVIALRRSTRAPVLLHALIWYSSRQTLDSYVETIRIWPEREGCVVDGASIGKLPVSTSSIKALLQSSRSICASTATGSSGSSLEFAESESTNHKLEPYDMHSSSPSLTSFNVRYTTTSRSKSLVQPTFW